jgi:hypothetical protein
MRPSQGREEGSIPSTRSRNYRKLAYCSILWYSYVDFSRDMLGLVTHSPMSHTPSLIKLSRLRLAWLFSIWAVTVFGVGVTAKVFLSGASATRVKASSGLYLPLVNFDAHYYLQIAEQGYTKTSPVAKAFFPLYPLLVRLGYDAFHVVGLQLSYAVVATGLSLLCGFVGLWLLGRLAITERVTTTASSSLLVPCLLLVSPFAFILLAPYTEGLLLLLTVAAFMAAGSKHWWLAGLLGAAASATRLPGLMVFPALAVEYMYQVKHSEERLGWRGLGVLLAPLGTIAYAAYLQLYGGGLKTYFKAYRIGWPQRKTSLNILQPLYRPIVRIVHDAGVPLAQRVSINDALSLGAFAIAVALLAYGWHQLRPSYRVYAILSLILPLTTTIAYGLGRYYLVIFPLYFAGASFVQKHRDWAAPMVLASAILQGLLIALFTTTHFVG